MRIEIPERKVLVYEMGGPIRWGDMDAMGHVNNTSYFRYMETIRIDWMRSIEALPQPKGHGPVIVNAFCNFHRSFTYPGTVRLRMYASDPGRSSFETWTELELDGEPGVLYATGGATTVWTDSPAQKSAPLPDEMRQRVSA